MITGSKIIIYGGRFQDSTYRTAEVVDLLNPNLECDVPFHENEIGYAGYGGRINDDFVYCGGHYWSNDTYGAFTDKCYKLGQIEPIFNITMSTSRWRYYGGDNGIVLPNNTLFLIGDT